GLVAALAAIALVATTSRGGLIGLGAAVAVLIVVSGRKARVRVAIAATVGVAVVLAAMFAFGLFDKFEERFHVSSEGRWINRFSVQWDAFRAFARCPVFGTGAGSFPAAYPPF